VELPAVPGLGGLYARGAATSARHAVASRVGVAARELPRVTYLARDVRADAGRLTAYQHLLGESASDVLPAGFVHVLAFPVATALMVRADFPLPLAGLLHLANTIEQLRPVSVGDRLEVRAYARGLRPHRSGTQVELVAEVRVGAHSSGAGVAGEHASVPGELAWRGVSTYLARTHPAVSDPARARARAGSDTSRGVQVGVPALTGQWRLDADVGRRYAAVSGDRNPIHLSALSARALGFPRAIAHGMYTASRALATVGPARTEAFSWTVEFVAPVLLPGTVTVRVAALHTAPTGVGYPAPAGFGYTGWNARSGKVHLTGTVLPC
jgi:acyl dehydratase